MDKQTLRYTYLTYFAGQYAKKEELSFDTLEEMAGGNFNLEKEVLKDLINEELIEGIEISEDKLGTKIIQHNGKLKLTTKGIKEILNLFPDEKKEIIKDIKFDIENQKHKILTLEDIINKENERIAKLSKKEKIKEIKEKIFLLFWDYNININKYAEGKILHSEIKSKIRKIVQHYYDGAISTLSKEAIDELRLEGYVQYKYEDRNSEIQISTLLTPKGIAHIKNEQEKKESELQEYIEKNNLKIPNEIIKIQSILAEIYSKTNSTQLQAATDMMKNSKVQVAMKALESTPVNRVMQNINKYYSPLYNESVLNNYGKLINSINNSTKTIKNNLNSDKKSLSEIINDPPSNLYKALTNDSKSNNDPKAETYTFEGILGQNCGEVVTPTSEDEKRIQEKGFKVENGIKVLRGFANSAILAFASKKDENYQREENIEHLNAIEKFVENMRASAKYLPEVTLIARGYEKLERINLSGTLSKTQKGELDNLEYYKLTVSADKLYRIDGNHRLEALKKDNYYIPFSIIIWEDTDINLDDEAFLFYFLNSKAKKLTTEENIKGLVNAKNWTDNELETANVVLPYIKYFKDKFEEHTLFNREYYRNSHGVENVKTQILNVLELINKETGKDILPFNKKTFGDYIGKLQEILSQRDRFKYLREHFRCFPQFVFYTLYKYDGNIEDSISFINAVNKWAEYYKHDYNSFIQPNKMFYNASKQLDRKINIFVAMPYYDETIVAQFNKTLRSIVEELKQEDELLKDKLNLYPIMTYKAESTDILANMDKQISECDIFIADISNHGKSKVNPNVMFELGRVYDKKKFLLIRNKDNKVTNSAFDIQHIDYIPIDYGMGFDTSMKENLKPRIMNIIKNIIGFC